MHDRIGEKEHYLDSDITYRFEKIRIISVLDFILVPLA